MRRFLALLVALLATAGIAVALTEFASASPTPTTAPAGTPAKPQIVIMGFGFHGNLVVRPGVTVHVVNRDGVTHTLTHKSKGSFDTGPISPGAHATFTAPKKVGKYPFHCTIHTDMNATLVVRRAPTG